jgi:RimJ/RimL family protein N-acetyltransferase
LKTLESHFSLIVQQKRAILRCGGDIRLETDRLILCDWAPEDWAQFHSIASDPEVMRYIGPGMPWPEEKSHAFVDRQIELLGDRQFCLWKLLPKFGGPLIGFCGLQPLSDTPEIEIGWWLARDRWGQGLATEAARAALRDGFERVGLARIVAIAQPANTASVHIMQKLGMRYEGTLDRRGITVVLYAIPAPSPPA